MISALNDSGAYYVGKKYGSKKIFPLTSPKKTLEGLMAGIFISSSTLYLVAYLQIIKSSNIAIPPLSPGSIPTILI